jgi:RimJ/RimL family protein N-acetyltransferase
MHHNNNILGQPIGFSVSDWKSPKLPSGEPMEGNFCRLERLNPAIHATSLYAANMIDVEGRMWTYLPYGPFDTLDNYLAWTKEICRNSDPLFYAIVDRATDRALGIASYLRIDPTIGSIEVGHISYSPLLQRTPVATEAMFLMMNHAFTLGYRRYEWKCNVLNAPSYAAAQRLGFSFEGVFRQATIVKGCNRDTAWFSVIDEEWPTLSDVYQRWLDPTNFDELGKQRLRLSEIPRQSKTART